MQSLGNLKVSFTPSLSVHPHRPLQNAGLYPRISAKPKLAIAISASASSGEQRFFATCAPGLEEVVAAELCSPAIAASNIKLGASGVSFTGTFRTAYNANLWLRCAIRVLVELAASPIPPRTGRRNDPIYEFIKESVDWKTLLVHDDDEDKHFHGYDGDDMYHHHDANGPTRGASSSTTTLLKHVRKRSRLETWRFRTFAIQSRTHDCPQVSNSMYASVRAKDAICDSIRNACGGFKPSPPEDGGATADVPLFLSIFRDHACLYRDMSGISLHRRGYRDAMHKASLNEAIAASCLTIAGWNPEITGFGDFNTSHLNGLSLLDPMCGSGTFLIEAALMACNRAPGLRRWHWPFQTWHDFNYAQWKECWDAAAAAIRPPPEGLALQGNDVHEGALSLCIKDAKSAGVHDLLNLSCKHCEEYTPQMQPSLVVVNPPWGSRLGMNSETEPENVSSIWQELGHFLKQKCNCADVYVLSGSSSATRGLRMKCNKKWPITVGGVECKLLHYYVLPPKNLASSEEVL